MSGDHVREFFLAHNGMTYRYETGHWFSISCTEVAPTAERPEGLKYALAFFDRDNRCLVRYDNSHAANLKGKSNPVAYDHWHRSGEDEETVPYRFTSVEQLIEDFWTDMDRHLPAELRASGDWA